MKLVGDTVAAMHVAGETRDLERLAAIVAFEQRPRRRRRPARFHEPPEPVRRVQAECDLGLHIGELLLHELIGGEGTAELLAIEHVLAGAMPAKHGPPRGAPRDAGPRPPGGARRAGPAPPP